MISKPQKLLDFFEVWAYKLLINWLLVWKSVIKQETKWESTYKKNHFCPYLKPLNFIRGSDFCPPGSSPHLNQFSRILSNSTDVFWKCWLQFIARHTYLYKYQLQVIFKQTYFSKHPLQVLRQLTYFSKHPLQFLL